MRVITDIAVPEGLRQLCEAAAYRSGERDWRAAAKLLEAHLVMSFDADGRFMPQVMWPRPDSDLLAEMAVNGEL